MLQPSLAKTFVSSSSTSPPDSTKSAVFCAVGATALLQGVVMSGPIYSTGLNVAAKLRPSDRCRIASRPEAGQSLGLIFKLGNNFQKVQHPKYLKHKTARTQQL